MNEPSRVLKARPTGGCCTSDAITPQQAIANPNCFAKGYSRRTRWADQEGAGGKQRAKNYPLLVYGGSDHEEWLELLI